MAASASTDTCWQQRPDVVLCSSMDIDDLFGCGDLGSATAAAATATAATAAAATADSAAAYEQAAPDEMGAEYCSQAVVVVVSQWTVYSPRSGGRVVCTRKR